MKTMVVMLSLAALFWGTDCAAVPTAAGYQRITAQRAQEMMQQQTNYTLLDVRTQAEYSQQRIDGATLIPVDELNARAQAELPNKDELILVYCRSGNRSATAAKQLIAMGYTNVMDFGGIHGWTYGTVGD